MNWKKICHRLFFPSPWLLVPLVVCSAGLLLSSALTRSGTDPVSISSYVLSFYTLVVTCLRIPAMICWLTKFRQTNPFLCHWQEDIPFRMKTTLTISLVCNWCYALFHLALGIGHHSLWYDSLSAYYLTLGVMRFFLRYHVAHFAPGSQLHRELRHYRFCGWVFLLTNLALTAMLFQMIFQDRLVRHHEITTIAMAAYTFFSLTMAVIQLISYRRYHSPVYSASKAISLASGLVSVLTLEGTMLLTFGQDLTVQTRRLFLSLSGSAVSLGIIAMALSMIVKSTKILQNMEHTHGAT